MSTLVIVGEAVFIVNRSGQVNHDNIASHTVSALNMNQHSLEANESHSSWELRMLKVTFISYQNREYKSSEAIRNYLYSTEGILMECETKFLATS